MTDQTIVAVYDTPAHAELAVQDIVAAGVPESAISRHSGTLSGAAAKTTVEPVRDQGFWASLFGGEADHDTAVYNRSLESGSTVVTVKTSEADVDRVMEILEGHHPVDIDERGTSYGLTQTTAMREPLTFPRCLFQEATAPAATTGGTTVQLAEESLAVGKRLVNRGGTRIRRYVVETPVEESVSLHTEKVTLDRRPVTDGRPVTDANFTDKSIEMTETTEEAVVSKTARIVEEVSLRKEATDRVETVRDTVRKEEVEVEKCLAKPQ